jgi:hypothetical protein
MWNLICLIGRTLQDAAVACCELVRDRLLIPVWNGIGQAVQDVRYIVIAGFAFLRNRLIVPICEVVSRTICTAVKFVYQNMILPTARAAHRAARWMCTAAEDAIRWMFNLATSNGGFAVFIGMCAAKFGSNAIAAFKTEGLLGNNAFCAQLACAGWTLCPLVLCLAGRALREMNLYGSWKPLQPIDRFGWAVERISTYWFMYGDSFL